MAKKKIKPGDGTMNASQDVAKDVREGAENVPAEQEDALLEEAKASEGILEDITPRSDPKDDFDPIPMPLPSYLKHPETRRVFEANEALLKRKDLIACNKEGTRIEDVRVFPK